MRLKADVIVVTTTPAAKAAKAATRSIPIVMYPLGDPVVTGLVASLNRPEGNVTGLTFMASGIAAKRLELLKEVVPLALEHKLPGLYPYRIMVDAGGLMALDSYTSGFQARTATYVDKILKGANPRDLPIERPTKFELIINMRTAKTLGLTIPSSLIVRADEFIE